jgi:hypothetical protein
MFVYTVIADAIVDRHFAAGEIALATSAMANGVQGRGGGGRGCGRHVYLVSGVIVFV